MARPSKYQTHVAPRLEEIKDWVRNGATDKEVAERLGISETSFYDYKNEFSEFSESIKKGKDYVDAEVENALLKRALGYNFNETTQELKDGKLVVTKVVRKHIVGDVGAQAFWLKNRRPDKWRDKPADSQSGDNGNDSGQPIFEFVFKDMTMKDENEN